MRTGHAAPDPGSTYTSGVFPHFPAGLSAARGGGGHGGHGHGHGLPVQAAAALLRRGNQGAQLAADQLRPVAAGEAGRGPWTFNI